MTYESHQPDDAASDFSTLQHQLRSLPQAELPAGLLERLRADIPAAHPTTIVLDLPRRVSRIRWIAATAAVLLIGLSVLATHRAESLGDAVSPQNVMRHVYLHESQETDPCSVLPPFPPSSRS